MISTTYLFIRECWSIKLSLQLLMQLSSALFVVSSLLKDTCSQEREHTKSSLIGFPLIPLCCGETARCLYSLHQSRSLSSPRGQARTTENHKDGNLKRITRTCADEVRTTEWLLKNNSVMKRSLFFEIFWTKVPKKVNSNYFSGLFIPL